MLARYYSDPDYYERVNARAKASSKRKRAAARATLAAIHGPGCFYCGIELDDLYHIDHVWPVSKGAPIHLRDIDNIRLACARCNLEKHDAWLWEWAERTARPLTSAALALAARLRVEHETEIAA